jgi:hypothetical protein
MIRVSYFETIKKFQFFKINFLRQCLNLEWIKIEGYGEH